MTTCAVNFSDVSFYNETRCLMTTCAVNCGSQVRQMSVYRALSGDYYPGAIRRDESPLGMITGLRSMVITRTLIRRMAARCDHKTGLLPPQPGSSFFPFNWVMRLRCISDVL